MEGVTKLNVGTITDMNFVFDLQEMITSAEDVSDIYLITNRKGRNALRKTEDYKDAGRNGMRSTIMTGVVDVVAGSQLFVTNLLKLTDSDGKVSIIALNNTQATFIAVDARLIQNGTFGEVQTNEERDFAVSDAIEAKVYRGMNNINDKFADKNFVAVGYNCQ